MRSHLIDPRCNRIDFIGADPEIGRLPALIYFSLSGEESLDLSPYNTPASLLANSPLRVFSFTIPGHGPDFDKHHAMQYWANEMGKGEYLLETFFDEVIFGIEWLIEQGLIDPDHLAVSGLSRGGFIATHIAARETRIKTVLGFAPLTQLSILEEFTSCRHIDELNLNHLVDRLTHLHRFRFYIGNRDLRVSTDACFAFIRKFADKVHEKRARHCHVELFITPSIGIKGHGTAPHIFEEGIEWIKKYVIPSSSQ